MANIRKYAFDTEFTPDGGIVSEAPKKFEAAEVETERKAAYKQGADDALAAAERQTAGALQSIADKMTTLITKLESESRAMRDEAARVALAAARKIAGAALEAYGEERAISAIEAVLDTLRHNPRLIVKLAPEACETLKPRIQEMADQHGYGGAILVRAQPGMRSGEVSIDWSDGVISMNPDDTAKHIEDLIDAALAAPTTHS